MVYGADVMVSMQQWLDASISALTGRSFGSRFPGGTMPNEAIPFKQIPALGDNWLEELDGLLALAWVFWKKTCENMCPSHTTKLGTL